MTEPLSWSTAAEEPLGRRRYSPSDGVSLAAWTRQVDPLAQQLLLVLRQQPSRLQLTILVEPGESEPSRTDIWDIGGIIIRSTGTWGLLAFIELDYSHMPNAGAKRKVAYEICGRNPQGLFVLTGHEHSDMVLQVRLFYSVATRYLHRHELPLPEEQAPE